MGRRVQKSWENIIFINGYHAGLKCSRSSVRFQVWSKTIKLIFVGSFLSTKIGLSQSHDNAHEWSNLSICRLLFQWSSSIKIQLSMLLITSSSYEDVLVLLWYSWKIANMALNNNLSLILWVIWLFLLPVIVFIPCR
jgi:hypothetical protein